MLCCYAHFADEEAEAQRDDGSCPSYMGSDGPGVYTQVSLAPKSVLFLLYSYLPLSRMCISDGI